MISGHSVSFKISEFIKLTPADIVGILNDPSRQTQAWQNQIKGLLNDLKGMEGRIIFEYGIPGLSKVVDVILLIDNKIFVLEYKNGSCDYNLSDKNQTLGYALRLKYYQSNCSDKTIIPILVATDATHIENPNKIYEDGIYHLVLSNENSLRNIINSYCGPNKTSYVNWYSSWEKGVFKATPGIIKAAKQIWNEQHVKGLTDDSSTLESKQAHLQAENTIKDIIEKTKDAKRKALIFITGVPGAGKTLVGLKISVASQEYGASMMSGNGPLVNVLSTALKRNFDLYKDNLKDEDLELLEDNKQIEDLKNKIAVDSIIRDIYGYKNEIIERLDYASHMGSMSSNKTPYSMKRDALRSTQHVVIYDEAQRAWSVKKMQTPGRVKKDWQTPEWSFSEPSLLLWDIDQLDWGVFICLVGGGQEINEGESGINEWLRTIVEDNDKVNLDNWDIYMAPDLNSKEYQLRDAHNHSIQYYIDKIENLYTGKIHYDKTLHLKECQRSPLATGLSDFINLLVEGNASQSDYDKIKNGYTISITRDLETARKYLRSRQKELTPLVVNENNINTLGDEFIRTGMLMSSSAARLRPLGFDIKKVQEYGHKTPGWFLDFKEDNIDSSDFLEVALNEFFVQGLEIDLACVIWDGDFRYDPNQKAWRFYQFNKKAWSEKTMKSENGRTLETKQKKKEENIRTQISLAYMRNAYRVLLTRARLGLVICVPNGSKEDPTRQPEVYDETYEYLLSLGFNNLDK
ncbi:MAG: DUF2075 domain-containing protein [Muribaculaceae bacterium]|nr:DUF2075 domain-containing protein [Muribaculaceae bacterium]